MIPPPPPDDATSGPCTAVLTKPTTTDDTSFGLVFLFLIFFLFMGPVYLYLEDICEETVPVATSAGRAQTVQTV